MQQQSTVQFIFALFLISTSPFISIDVNAYKSGAPGCVWADAMSSSRSGTGDFTLQVLKGTQPVQEITKGQTYTVQLKRNSGVYTGYLVHAVAGGTHILISVSFEPSTF